MKYLSKYLVIALLPFLLISCNKDDTTADTRVLSEIGIVFNEVKEPVLDMERDEVLTIDPVISQTEQEKGLKYEWEINYQVFSTEKKLVYPCSKLGSYLVRLKVSNDDGSTFKSFKLNVNSAYEEGLMVLAENEIGEGTLAFMRKYTDSEIANGRVESFVNNCFTLNNPDLKLGKFPTDIAKRVSQIYISSKGEQKIYILNDKTFELEAQITASDLPGFKPVKMSVPDNLGRDAWILCEQGKIYKVALLEFLVSSHSAFPVNVVEKSALGYDDNNAYSYYWSNERSRLEQINYYIDYYGLATSGDQFKGQRMVQFFYAKALKAADDRLYVITNDPANPSVYRKTVYDNLATKLVNLTLKEEADLTGGISATLNANSIIESNATYRKLLYANGNKIYSWFYTGTTSASAPFITIDAGVVTSMSQTPDGKILYVGVYNSASAGLKGSVYVYNMDTGALIKKHEGVTDKPVKLFYKKKS